MNAPSKDSHNRILEKELEGIPGVDRDLLENLVKRRTAELEVQNKNLAGELAELKRTEGALAASEQKFRTLINYTNDWVHWIAPDGHLLYISPSCERITGYRPDEFVNNPTLLSTIIHPEDQKFVQNHFQHLDSSGPYSSDFRVSTRSGEVRWIAHACQAVFSDDGRWLGRCGNNRDITERKQVEETSKIEERRLRSELNISI